MNKKNSNSGFTLVELAIVLVIIGLIVGGVLVGQDLIKAATMQKTIKQETDTEAAATTFRNKYNALPGDVKNPGNIFTNPLITGADLTGVTPGLANGDGIIQGATAGATTLQASGEAAVFYPELAQAGLIKEVMTNVDLASTAQTMAQINVGMFLPAALGRQIMFAPYSSTGRNYLIMTGPATGPAAASVPPMTAALAPIEASNIDAKLDDNNPATGNVIASDKIAPGIVPIVASANATTGCYTGATPSAAAYNASVLTQECNLTIRTSF